MPINRTGGNKTKKRKNTSDLPKTRKLEDIAKNSSLDEVYGKVLRAQGNRRFTVLCQQKNPQLDYREINCQLKGSYKKTVKAGDFALIQMWEFEDKGTIIDTYISSEINRLDASGFWDFKYKPALSDQITDITDLIEFIDDENDNPKQTHTQSQSADRTGPANNADDSDIDIDAI